MKRTSWDVFSKKAPAISPMVVVRLEGCQKYVLWGCYYITAPDI